MDKAKYAAGLNEFSYCGTLYVSHRTLDPADITSNLGISPTRSTSVGQAHRAIPNRVCDSSHWSCDLPTTDGDDIPAFLQRVVDLLSPHRRYLEELARDGGEIVCFVGIFADRLCDQMFPHELLQAISSLRVNLRFDFYTSEDRTNEI